MGNAYECQCVNPACGYEAVISGGKAFGMLSKVETMVCLDCKELRDVEIARTAPTKSGFKAMKKKCGECGSVKLRKFYKSKTRCPKCGGRLKTNYDAWILWD
jgi:uncharacterized paraquat-inducible protein A